MYGVESKEGTIGCMLLTLFFLGTWRRLPQHTYLDYSITNLLAAVIIALTFGQIGDSQLSMPNFITQLYQDNWPCVLFAMAGGVLLSVGNLANQYAWAMVGLSVTKVVCSSIKVILFPRVACFLVAVCLRSALHSSNSTDNKAKLCSYVNEKESNHASNIGDGKKDMEDGTIPSEKAEVGTVGFLIELENNRAIKVFVKSTLIGLGMTFFAVLCFSLFSPAFNLATNDQLGTMKEGDPHSVIYTAFFHFSVSCLVVAIVLNIIFLYYPVFNLPRSSLKAYVNDWNGRNWALLAGFLCGFGNGLQFMGGQAAGYAATFWGILVFGEDWKSLRRTYVLLVSMLLMFIVAVGILMASSGKYS
ncbi:hypothetical protein MKW98_018911 [Papaver atlanticum]|uniref:Ureide permease 1-like n=1 Tax=Papaver atlanticum TaxID=357466 RepID=A0AAD4XXA4_9MAGN|nr:hypothetical protein MKW98_018911 [Papaver atlanticum]